MRLTRSAAVAAFVALGYALPAAAVAQQVPDTAFRPAVPRPAWATGAGPHLCLDEAHHNFHTLANRLWAFGELARRDGFRVAPLRARFSAASLGACDLLVISNAMPNETPWNTYPAPTPEAFAPDEVAAVRRWVEGGGRLLLIADHQPLAGAARRLGEAFGVEFFDGFAVQRAGEGERVEARLSEPTLFLAGEGLVAEHPIARGRDASERVTQVRSFTGQAFRVRAGEMDTHAPVLVLPDDFVSLEPRYAWVFDSTTVVRDVGGWLQGATLELGRGRVAIFGEAAMFSAQVAGAERRPMGMNAPMAEENARFVLNVLHWVMGVLP
jgi:hypothetical protein